MVPGAIQRVGSHVPAFIPGGYGGIGAAVAWGMAIAGAKVAVAGRSIEKAEEFAGELRAAGHTAFGIEMDAHSVASIRAAVDAAFRAKYGVTDWWYGVLLRRDPIPIRLTPAS